MRIIELTNYDLILHKLDIDVKINHTEVEIDKSDINQWVVYDETKSFEKYNSFLLHKSPCIEYSFLIRFNLMGHHYRECIHLIPTRYMFNEQRLLNAQNQIKLEIFNHILLNPKDIISDGQIRNMIEDIVFRV